jgi:hypothetical protein
MASTVATLQAAPLPTNVASMKSMVADRSIQTPSAAGTAAAGDTEVSEAGVIEVGVGEGARLLVPSSVARSRAAHMAIMGAARITAAMTPATATIRPTAVIIGKQSKNPGSLASTDLTDTARRLGAIDKREF